MKNPILEKLGINSDAGKQARLAKVVDMLRDNLAEADLTDEELAGLLGDDDQPDASDPDEGEELGEDEAIRRAAEDVRIGDLIRKCRAARKRKANGNGGNGNEPDGGLSLEPVISPERAAAVVDDLTSSQWNQHATGRQPEAERAAKIGKLLQEIVNQDKARPASDEQLATEVLRLDPSLRLPEESWRSFLNLVRAIGKKLGLVDGGNGVAPPSTEEPDGAAMSISEPGTEMSDARREAVLAELSRNAGLSVPPRSRPVAAGSAALSMTRPARQPSKPSQGRLAEVLQELCGNVLRR